MNVSNSRTALLYPFQLSRMTDQGRSSATDLVPISSSSEVGFGACEREMTRVCYRDLTQVNRHLGSTGTAASSEKASRRDQ
jgi:hypothetical protein